MRMPGWIVLFLTLGLTATRSAGQMSGGAAKRVLIVTRIVSSKDNQVNVDLAESFAKDLDDEKPSPELTRQLKIGLLPLASDYQVIRVIEGKSWRLLDRKFRHEVSVQRVNNVLRASSVSAPVFERIPGPEKAGMIGRISPFQIVYVHEEARNHFRIGTTPDALPGTILGWVSADSAAVWNTRLALEWDWTTAKARKSPAKIWATAEDAHLAFDMDKSPTMTFQESPGPGNAERMSATQMRFPLLEWPAASAFPNFRLKDQNPLFLVGVIKKEEGNQDQLIRLNRALEEAQNALKKVDLMFVIDKTGSMSFYKKELGEAIRQIGQQILKAGVAGDSMSLRVAVTYFWDYDSDEDFKKQQQSGKAPIAIRPWTEAADEKVFEQQVQSIQNEKYAFGETPYAQVYLGLAQALGKSDGKERGWREHARRLVIVISDGGNRKDFQPSSADADEIVQRLFAGVGNPAEFYAIRMALDKRVRPTPEELASHKQFEKDMNLIITKIDQESARRAPPGTAIRRAPRMFDASDGAQLQKSVQTRFTELTERNASLREEIRAIQGGSRPSSLASPYIRDLVRASGFDLDKIPNYFHEGYLWKWDDQAITQVRPVALVSRSELTRLVETLDAVGQANSSERRPLLDRTIKQTLACVLGEDGRSDLAQYPVVVKRRALGNNLTTLVSRYPGILDQIDDELIERLRRIHSALTRLLRPAPGEPAAQFTLPGSPETWYWIELEKLP